MESCDGARSVTDIFLEQMAREMETSLPRRRR